MIRRTRIKPTAKRARVSWRSGKVRLDGAGMRELRGEVFRRAGGRCENTVKGSRCNQQAGWYDGELHHIVHRSRGGSDTLENSCWTCWDCHHAHHNGGPQIERFEAGV